MKLSTHVRALFCFNEFGLCKSIHEKLDISININAEN